MRKTLRRLEAVFGAAALATTGLIVIGLGVVAGPSLPAGADTGCTSMGTGTVTVTCSVGTDDSWTVPSNVTSATFAVDGAAGGSGTGKFGSTTGGDGGVLRSILAVTAGQTYGIEVGSAGGNGDGTTGLAGVGGTPGGGNGGIFCGNGCFQGGGGGGASFIDMGGSAPSDWLLMAGGGGGGGTGIDLNGGAGGGLSGGSGFLNGAAGGTQVALSGSGTQLNGGNDFSGGGGGGGGGGYWGGASGSNIGEAAGGGSGFITGSATGPGFSTSNKSGNGAVTITYTVNSAPAITSDASAVFDQGTQSQFEVDTTGSPTPSLVNASEGGCTASPLPTGLSFTDNQDGTATIASTVETPDGSYQFCITASNGVSPDAVQTFELLIGVPPAFTSAASDVFSAGTGSSYLVTTSGTPTPTLTNASEGSCMASPLPSGLTFKDNGDGTGTIASTLATPAGVYTFCLAASNGVTPEADQTFTLTVAGAQTSLTVAASPSTAVYGTTVTFTGTLSGGLSGADEPMGSISMDAWPLANCNGSPITGDPSFSLGTDNNVTSGNGTYTLGTQSPPVGTYHLNDYFEDSDGFNDSVGSGCDAATLTVTQAPLSIAAPTETIPFGTTPNLTPTYTGFVNGDTSASLSTQPNCTTKATATSAPGSYKVTCSGAVDPNYAITYTTGKITIVAAASTFSINDFLTKGVRTTTAVLGEVGIPTGAHGTVTFKIGTRVLCTITLTGQADEATTCMANLGMGFSGAITATFADTDGDYASSTATNQLNITF